MWILQELQKHGPNVCPFQYNKKYLKSGNYIYTCFDDLPKAYYSILRESLKSSPSNCCDTACGESRKYISKHNRRLEGLQFFKVQLSDIQ